MTKKEEGQDGEASAEENRVEIEATDGPTFREQYEQSIDHE